LTVRANTLQTTRDALIESFTEHGVESEPVRFAPDGLAIRRGNPLLTPLASRGRFFVQDEASQLVSLLVGARPGERILDACAAPGGKTVAMAAAMENRGMIVATDIRGRRVDLLARTVREAGASCVSVVRADVSSVLPFASTFDAVLLDAPCSGLGTLRRDPDIRWRRKEADLAALSATQAALMDRAAEALVRGGRLLYATCSSEPEENDEVVRGFLEGHPEFELRPIATVVPELERFSSPEGFFRTLPFRDGLEAFFAAMLVKSKDLR
jgi:16S rRNA (cytosine967-C5)-methyltransferase